MPTSTIRPATPADATAVTALMNQVDELEIGRPETDLHTVLADLEHPDTDLERDSWLVTDDGQVVVFGLLWDPSGGERIDVDLYALPSHQAEAARTVAAMEARALEKARANGAARAVVHLHLNAAPTLDTGLLTERGWRVVRRYHVLHRPLDPTRDPLPEPPPACACAPVPPRRTGSGCTPCTRSPSPGTSTSSPAPTRPGCTMWTPAGWTGTWCGSSPPTTWATAAF